MPESSSEFQPNQSKGTVKNPYDANITPEGEIIRPVYYVPKESGGLNKTEVESETKKSEKSKTAPLTPEQIQNNKSRQEVVDEVTKGKPGERAQWVDPKSKSFTQKGEGFLRFTKDQIEGAKKEMGEDQSKNNKIEVGREVSSKVESNKSKNYKDTERFKNKVEKIFGEEEKRPINKMSVAAVGVKGEVNREGVTVAGKFGKETKINVVEEELQKTAAEAYARRRQESDLAREHNSFFGRVVDFPRYMWRSMNRGNLEKGVGSFVKRDQAQGLAMTEAGKTGVLSEEIIDQVGRDAAERIRLEREKIGGVERGWRRLGNFMRDLAGQETDEYRAEVAIMREKREAYDKNTLDEKDPYFAYFQSDRKAQEEVALRFSSGAMDALGSGEKLAGGIKIEKGTPVHEFYNKVYFRIAKDVLENGKFTPELRRQLEEELNQFYVSPMFREFFKTLSPEQQAAFSNSLTYSTDMLVNAEKLFVPAVLESQDYYKSVDKLDMEIELTLGTAKFGPNGELTSEHKNKKNAEIAAQLKEKFDNIGAEALFNSSDIDLGVQRANMLDTVRDVMTSAPAWLAYGYVVTNVASSALRTTSGALAPLTGAIFAGVRSGVREYGSIRNQFSEMEVSGGYGLVRKETGRAAKRSVEISRREHQRISMPDRSLEINALMEGVKNPESKDQVMRLMAITADSDARRRLGDANNINLLKSDFKEGGEANEILRYQQEKRNHDEAVVKGKLALYNYYKGNRGDFDTLAKNLGVSVNESGDLSREDFDKVFNSIRQNQEAHLYNATTIDPRYQAVLSSVTNEGFSISESRRQKENYRRRTAITNGVTTGVIAGVFAWGAQAWAQHHAEIVASGHEAATSQSSELLSNQSTNIPGMNGVTDTSGVVHNFQASLPEGTSFVHNPDGTYSLFDQAHHEVLNGIKIGEDGGILNIDQLNEQASSRGLDMIIGNQHGSAFEVAAGVHTIPGTEGHWDISSAKDLVEIRPGEKDGGLSQILLESHPGMRNPVLNLMKNFGRGMDKDGLVNWHIDTSKGDYGHVVREVQTMFGNEHFVGAQALDSVAEVPKAYLDSADAVGTLYEIGERYVDHGVVPSVGEMPQVLQDYIHAGHSVDEVMNGLSGFVSSGRGHEENVMDGYALFKDLFLETKTWVPGTPGSTEPLTDMMSQEIPFVRLFDNPEVVVPFTPIIPILPFESHPGLVRPDWSTAMIKEGENPYKYISYMENPSPEEEEMLKKRLSKTLIENPKAKLDDRFEIREYLNKQEGGHKKKIEEYKKQLGPMSPGTKLSVMIPVADHQEGKNIYRSLESYAGQTADKDSFEIVLFLNHPQFNKEGKQIKPDNTMEEVERFRKDHPEMKIRVMRGVLPKDKAKIGYIRKALSDTILARQLDRYESSSVPDDIKPLVIASNDADNLGIVPEYIQNFIDKFEGNPEADAMLGQIDWDTESYVKFPAVHIGTRLFQYIDMQYRHGEGRVQSSGANFAYTSSIYAATGGYVQGKELAEDVLFGNAIKIGRKSSDTIKFAGVRKSRLFTSARRAIYVLKRHGAAPIDQWGHGFSAHDDEVRKFLLGQENDIDYDNPKEVDKVVKEVESVINKTIKLSSNRGDYMKLEPKAANREEIQKRALGLLGIEYNLVKVWDGKERVNEVRITNADSLINDLKHFKEIGILKKKIMLSEGTGEEVEQMKVKLKNLEDNYRKVAT